MPAYQKRVPDRNAALSDSAKTAFQARVQRSETAGRSPLSARKANGIKVYRKEIIQDYFDGKKLDWNVRLVDTGVDTDTGGRIVGCRDVLEGSFFATYACASGLEA